nr:hypothetical protein [Woeseiaceae bacterium]
MTTSPEIETLMLTCGRDARRAFQALGRFSSDARNSALLAAADAIQDDRALILEANAADLDAAREKGLSAAMLDRLALDADRLRGISDGLRSIAADRPFSLAASRSAAFASSISARSSC